MEGKVVVDATFEGGDGAEAFHHGAGDVGALGDAIELWQVFVFEQRLQAVQGIFTPDGWEGVEDIVVVAGVADQGEDFAGVDIHDGDGCAIGVFRPAVDRVGIGEELDDGALEVGIDGEPDGLGDARADFAEDAQTRSIGADEGEFAAGLAGEGGVHAGFDAGFADDGFGVEADRFEGGDLSGIGVADVADDMGHEGAVGVAAGGLLAEGGAAEGLNAIVGFDEVGGF